MRRLSHCLTIHRRCHILIIRRVRPVWLTGLMVSIVGVTQTRGGLKPTVLRMAFVRRRGKLRSIDNFHVEMQGAKESQDMQGQCSPSKLGIAIQLLGFCSVGSRPCSVPIELNTLLSIDELACSAFCLYHCGTSGPAQDTAHTKT